MIRLLLVDDQNLIRRGLRALLKTDPDLEIVGEAEHGRAAIDLVAMLQPDVVLIDVRMPILDGVEATRAILPTVSADKGVNPSPHLTIESMLRRHYKQER